MNLWFRLLWLLLTSPFRPRLSPPLDVSRLSLRVLPNDLDVNLHMNNGRYLTLFDLGRFDMVLRMGLAQRARRNGWIPVLSAASVLFRRELRLFQRFELETAIVWWAGSQFVMEHRALTGGKGQKELAARALMTGGIYDRRSRRFVPVEELFAAMGVAHRKPPPATPDIEAALAAVETMRRTARRQAQQEPQE